MGQLPAAHLKSTKTRRGETRRIAAAHAFLLVSPSPCLFVRFAPHLEANRVSFMIVPRVRRGRQPARQVLSIKVRLPF